MAQDNARTLRGILEEWDPAADVEAWKQGRTSARVFLLDPDVVYEDGVLPDQMRETDRIVGTGDRLVSIHRAEMTARHSGIEVRTPLAYL